MNFDNRFDEFFTMPTHTNQTDYTNTPKTSDAHYTQGPKTSEPERITGAELQTLREACNLSREELGGLVGVQSRTIKHWESGRAGVPGDVAAMLERLDTMITKGATQAVDVVRRDQQNGAPLDLVLLRYRSTEDLHRYHSNMASLPASVHAAIVGRVRLLAHGLGVVVRVVWLDPEAYESWRAGAGMADSEAARDKWAAGQVAAQALPHKAGQALD